MSGQPPMGGMGQAPGGMGGMMGQGGGMERHHMMTCPMMMGAGGGMMGGMMPGMGMTGASDPKAMGLMLQMRGEMMQKMGEIIMKYGRAMEGK